MKKEEPEWATVVGAVFLCLLFSSLALVAAGGWNWFAKFLETSAPSWVQAIGSVAAIVAAVLIARGSERRERIGANQQATVFKETLIATLIDAQAAAAGTGRYSLHEVSAAVGVAVQMGEGLRLELLPLSRRVSTYKMRALSGMAKARLDSHISADHLDRPLGLALANSMGFYLQEVLELDSLS
ncbi:hypothetical protein J2W28_001050 [Variovorax boronicumulans]|uniref:hypothetical protein n=1 Tax=Variovorax boronicumulans TaxID=436515 RepID=UPI0027869B12|nr:hypothetical protein [Variovorax boronicumulans]MDP9992022.1 hypothetical protein [Variovorax boronicumulans]MDQ0001917.1 hypothetical protein [Variovorax boronicumulans]